MNMDVDENEGQDNLVDDSEQEIPQDAFEQNEKSDE